MDAGTRLDICELLARAAWGLDEKKIEWIEQCFAAESVFVLRVGENAPVRFEGHEAIVKLFADSMKSQKDVRRHQVSNVHFESVGERAARVISNLTLVSIADGAARVLTTGIYRDDVVLEGGAWRLARRDLYLDLPY